MNKGKVVSFPSACKITQEGVTKEEFYIALYELLKFFRYDGNSNILLVGQTILIDCQGIIKKNNARRKYVYDFASTYIAQALLKMGSKYFAKQMV